MPSPDTLGLPFPDGVPGFLHLSPSARGTRAVSLLPVLRPGTLCFKEKETPLLPLPLRRGDHGERVRVLFHWKLLLFNRREAVCAGRTERGLHSRPQGSDGVASHTAAGGARTRVPVARP